MKPADELTDDELRIAMGNALECHRYWLLRLRELSTEEERRSLNRSTWSMHEAIDS